MSSARNAIHALEPKAHNGMESSFDGIILVLVLADDNNVSVGG
jgi:hypothetical protein